MFCTSAGAYKTLNPEQKEDVNGALGGKGDVVLLAVQLLFDVFGKSYIAYVACADAITSGSNQPEYGRTSNTVALITSGCTLRSRISPVARALEARWFGGSACSDGVAGRKSGHAVWHLPLC